MRHAQFLPARRAVVLALGGGLTLPGLCLPAQGTVGTAHGSSKTDAAMPGDTNPNALYAQSFASLDQGEVAMRGFLGKPLVVNFWASWCPPCVKEMPDLQALSETHPEVGFVGLAVDTQVNVRRFVQKTPVSYPILISGHGGIERMRDLGNRQGGLPFTVLFDAQGRVRQQILGPVHVGRLDGFIRALDA